MQEIQFIGAHREQAGIELLFFKFFSFETLKKLTFFLTNKKKRAELGARDNATMSQSRNIVACRIVANY